MIKTIIQIMNIFILISNNEKNTFFSYTCKYVLQK